MKTNESLRVAIYCRVARKDQDAIDTQKQMLTASARSEGHKLIACYCDNGASGMNFDRPAFQHLQADIQMRQVDLVMVTNISRIGRNMVDAINWINMLTESGIVLKCTNMPDELNFLL